MCLVGVISACSGGWLGGKRKECARDGEPGTVVTLHFRRDPHVIASPRKQINSSTEEAESASTHHGYKRMLPVFL